MPKVQYIYGDGWQTGVLVGDEPRSIDDGPALTPTLGEYPIYDAPLYDVMAGDAERNWRFRDALEKYAPGRTVIDIGTGAFLFWARESLRLGANRALAIESMSESYQAASKLLSTIEDGQRITLLHGESTSLTIDQEAELCVAEIIGSLPGAEGAAAVLSDAKQRHLTIDAKIISDLCLTQAAAVNFADLFANKEAAFTSDALPKLKQIFDSNGAAFDVRLRVANPNMNAIISDSAVVERLDFNGNLQTEQVANVRLTISRPGMVDGLLTWLQIRCLPDQEPLDALHHKSN
ncbi:MAG: class I SAM-dependent methyltransferase [Verrucomicrobiota bacterium]